MKDLVTILMATYNGGKYLEQQIDSIVNQTHTNWKLVIRDDQSSDNTLEVTIAYQSRFPDKITVVKDGLANLGSVKNFEQLLHYRGNANYIMFCDQDDYWLPNKIEITLVTLQEAEKQDKHQTPILVFTDFNYADALLNPISEKENFSAYTSGSTTLPRLLAQNPAYGCTMMLNSSLAALVRTIPIVAENHDYWIMLVAQLFGEIIYLNKKTILYRQHGGNISGGHNDSSLLNRIRINLLQKGKVKLARKRLQMLDALVKVYGDKMTHQQQQLITSFIHFAHAKNLFVGLKLFRTGVKKNTTAQTALFYLSFLLLKSDA